MDVIDEGYFDVDGFANELVLAASNGKVGTTLSLENEWVRVWEVRVNPGERCPFHAHAFPYFWTCVAGGIGKQRSPDGTMKIRRYADGETQFSTPSVADPLIHDLENVGNTILRFVTVELLR